MIVHKCVEKLIYFDQSLPGQIFATVGEKLKNGIHRVFDSIPTYTLNTKMHYIFRKKVPGCFQVGLKKREQC